jgi:acyl-coenzyme A thioesterase PaaI-like protein
MNRAKEPVQVVKERRDAALNALVAGVPYINFMGIVFERRGDELTGIMPYQDMLIGNPILPALHGGATAAFLEVTAIIGLGWSVLWDEIESGTRSVDDLRAGRLPRLPKTIDLTVDYLRSGLPRDAYARAEIARSGRRYASVRVEAWQDNRARPFAQASGHFLMPRPAEAGVSGENDAPKGGPETSRHG